MPAREDGRAAVDGGVIGLDHGDINVIRMMVLLPLTVFEIWYTERRMTSGWIPGRADASCVTFPNRCPMCMGSPADDFVIEKSKPRTVGWYLFASREKWHEIEVPYCESCRRKIEHDQTLQKAFGLFLAAPCAVGMWLFFGLDQELLGDFIGSGVEVLLYGASIQIPIFLWLKFRNKGIALGRYGSDGLALKVRNQAYFKAFSDLNAPENVPG